MARVSHGPQDETVPAGPGSSEAESGSSLGHEKNGVAQLPVSPTSPFTRDIVFADEVQTPPSLHEELRIPEQRSTDQHIAFLENQRNPKDKGTLRIPGPRDYDRGVKPQSVDEDDDETEPSQPPGRVALTEDDAELNSDDHQNKPNVIRDDLQHVRGLRKGLSAFKLRPRGEDGEPSTTSKVIAGLRNRSRTNTFASSRSQNSASAMPYLSWEPTIGRNSAFVDLSAEQREELGGIEYRALKTLAWILCSEYFSRSCLRLLLNDS